MSHYLAAMRILSAVLLCLGFFAVAEAQERENPLAQIVTKNKAVAEHQRFKLTAQDYKLLSKAMGQRPHESDFPDYDKPDNFVKFWMYGDQPEETKIPDGLRMYNKVGWAYGYLTDAAYVTDAESGREFILVGTIHVNENRIFNDGVYEYETIGLPFFGQLGRAVLAYEREK